MTGYLADPNSSLNDEYTEQGGDEDDEDPNSSDEDNSDNSQGGVEPIEIN